MSHFKKARKRCPLSDPQHPHYFRPLYRNQTACCVIGTPTLWPEREALIPSDKRRKLLTVMEKTS